MTREQMIDEAVRRNSSTTDFCATCIDSGVLCSFCEEDIRAIRAEFRRIASN